MTTTGPELGKLLVGYRYTYQSEVELQGHLAQRLTDAGFTARREVHVAPRCRIDVLVGRVGIEVKIDGSVEDVAWQLQRYARSPLLDTLVLATTCARHRRLPASIAGMPIHVAYLTPHLT
jgi:hypothetical protein